MQGRDTSLCTAESGIKQINNTIRIYCWTYCKTYLLAYRWKWHCIITSANNIRKFVGPVKQHCVQTGFLFTTSLLFCDLDFHQTVAILVSTCTICSPFIIDLLLYLREAIFIHGIINCQVKKLSQFICFTFLPLHWWCFLTS